MAPSDRLGTIRVIAVLCALLNVVFADFTLLAQTGGPWYEPAGILSLLPHLKLQILFSSPELLMIFKAVLILSLAAAMLGVLTPFSLLISTVLYWFYLAVLAAHTVSLDSGVLPLYLMFMMIWLPSGEGFSLDYKWRRQYPHLRLDDRPSASIAWGVFLVRAVVAFSFFQSGFSKLENTGLGWVQPWRFQQFIIEDSLIFDHTAWIPRLLSAPPVLWTLLACFYLGLELFFPVILLVRDLRILYPFAAVIVRSLSLVPQNIYFHDLMLLQFIFYDWDRILPLRPVQEQDRRKNVSLFRFWKTS